MTTATDNAARRVLDAWADLTVNDFIQLASDNGMEVDGCAVWLRTSDNTIVAFRQLEDGPEEWTEIPVPVHPRRRPAP